MPLREEFAESGAWCFRWRSYLPLVVLAAVFASLGAFRNPGGGERPGDAGWEALCLAVSMLGLAVRVVTVGFAPAGTSGRNTRKQVAKQVNTTGMYSVVRHPLYVGNLLMWAGVALFPGSPWLFVAVVLAFALYYERIMFAEEEFLRAQYGEEYLAWARRTPAFIPDPRLWRRPALPFSLRSTLRREYSGLFGVVAVFTVLEVAGDWVASGRLFVTPAWALLFGLTLAMYVALRTLKRHTTLLRVPGR